MVIDYTSVTETPANKVTKENLQMLYARYKWASQFIQKKDILEVACGAGMGLGYLAKKAKKTTGCDYDANLVKIAKNYYKNRVDILQCDAQYLPFQDNTFDVVILFEAIYYLPHPEKFLDECKRVLRKDGIVLVCTANKDCDGFNPSPFSIKYFSAPEIVELFERNNFKVELLGNFMVKTSSFMDKCKFLARKMAILLHVMPKTMKGKEKLKRIFYGKLVDLPDEIQEEIVKNPAFEVIDKNLPNHKYKVIYVVGYLK